MRPNTDHIERYRIATEHFGNAGFNGAFEIPHPPTGVRLLIIASNAMGWDHVSVSLKNRIPNWREMEFVCRKFWSEDEAVMQLHPPRSEWVSYHPNCLHLWKPQDVAIPLPPSIMVGPKDIQYEGFQQNTKLMADMAAGKVPGRVER